ncbi:Protein phosphatase 2C 4 [Mycena sanguinolenta]|uniref:Protein phosphatase 2C 4 n=1 Tax=Mycena sanguinolenta TaxID=230812 RepID=A0A8H7CJ37_9AGAR|nr:Protein phosphatase 2C 4 [Mycena sanguinolenta]
MLSCLSRTHRVPFVWKKSYHDYVRAFSPGSGIVRVPLASPKVIGVVNSRGTRSHQEDFYSFVTLSLDPEELRLSVKKAHGAVFIGIYDGHGGSGVSQYLRQELHGLVESVNKSHIPELYAWIQEIGGYFKRFKGGALAPWISNPETAPPLDLEARMAQAFFEVDRHLSADNMAQSCGATASKLALTVAHCGDTRVLLCSTDGKVHPMTENHHADARVEAIRLRRMMGSSLITDSFGESRWMGALANTRCLGDLRYKRFGVTPEPEVRTKLLEGSKWAYLVLVSDGISSILSDSEIVDLARNAPDPKTAANRILSFAEELGAEDNVTAIVVPLAGWGKIQGPDSTRELREYRRLQAVGSERQRRM